jgi:DNA-directed RNA polymerase alpha subunit
MQREGTLRTCDKGHQFIKKSDCLSCPICENERKPKDHFMSALSAPARRALENNGITSIEQLVALSEKELLQFHGMGKSSIPKLKAVLQEHDLRLGKDCV